MRMFVARFNFSCTLIGNHPQSLTGHTANVSGNITKLQILKFSNYVEKLYSENDFKG
jgi:hypothetical protein